MEPMTSTDGRAVMERFWAASETGDADALRELVHEEFVMEWPQSGERFTGRDNAFKAMAATEVKPEMAGDPRIVGSGDVWVVMAPVRYAEDTYRYVAIFELDAGLLRHATEFFGAPFPAQPGRAPYADSTPEVSA